MATGNMHTNLLKFGRVVFELCKQTDKQTNTHTPTQLITMLCTSLKGK